MLTKRSALARCSLPWEKRVGQRACGRRRGCSLPKVLRSAGGATLPSPFLTVTVMVLVMVTWALRSS